MNSSTSDFTKPDPDRWRNDESLSAAGQLLDQLSGHLRLVSFDFFDTLICRLCPEPEDLFIEVGRRLAQQQMFIEPLSPGEFRAARQAADGRAREHATRDGRPSEIKLADIYAELQNVVRDPAAACRLEFSVERLFCYLNPAMASFVEHVRSRGLPVVILSDTYFTSAELRQLLIDNGFSPDLFKFIFASSELGRPKYNGQSYYELFRHFNIHPNELLHIGDNLMVDVSVPRTLGVQTLHYYRTDGEIKTILKAERSSHGPYVHCAAGLDSVRILTARQAQDDKDAFREGAMVFGPVLTRFADWAARRFAAAGIRKVLALMREGELLGEMLQNAARAAEIPLEVVPCYVSRLSTARASLPELTPEYAAQLFEGGASLTPSAVLEVLGIEEQARAHLPQETLRRQLPASEILPFLQLLFRLPRLKREIATRHKQSLELAYGYLSELAGEETVLGAIDLGWSGSIQRNVARILRRNGRKLRTVGCYLACTPRAGKLCLDGDGAHAYMDDNWDRSAILPEIAITACVGSTNGYARNSAGKVVPVLGDFEITPEERLIKERLRAGVLAFQARWLEFCKIKGQSEISTEMLADLDRHSAAILYRLIDHPTQGEAHRLGKLKHDENYFGKNYSAPLCDERSMARLRKEGIQSLFRGGESYWPQGVVATQNPRLISALRSGWSDPLALGRLGAFHQATTADAPLSDEELGSLVEFLCGLAPEQIIFCGQFSPGVEELFLHIRRREKNRLAQLVVLGPKPEFAPNAELAGLINFVASDASDVSVCRSIRSHLAHPRNTVLVLTGDVSPTRARPLLNGLAPFLGGHGAILAACGLYDHNSLQTDAPLAQPMLDWCKTTGADLGYGVCAAAGAEMRANFCNWIFFRRAAETFVWNRQWTFSPGDNLVLS